MLDLVDNVSESFFDLYCKENWKQAKKQTVSHEYKKTTHSCDHYVLNYKSEYKMEVNFYWVHCSKCNETRRKYVIAWNSDKGTAYEKELLRPSEKRREF